MRCCYAAAPQPDPGPMHTASLSNAGLSKGSPLPETAPGIADVTRGMFRSYLPLMLAAVAAITTVRLRLSTQAGASDSRAGDRSAMP